MSKRFFYYAVLGMTASISASAMQTSSKGEIAMVKCSKESGYYPEKEKGSCNQNQCRTSQGMERRGEEQKYSPRCSEQRCCGSKYCSHDMNGHSRYALDSAGRRRYVPVKSREYKITEQKNCNGNGRCQEYTQLLQSPNESRTSIVEVQRKSAAQKVLEGY